MRFLTHLFHVKTYDVVRIRSNVASLGITALECILFSLFRESPPMLV